ncbi:uncharacterized protein LOC121884119 [Thunnus maccoyii]|uniref:uncharacterized protein LOC121884119 n=1 Tax=Thunnus maccoyii TaxID=8240 RepID=UPI001C4BE594|nr:uncharacterized protein LOC121884119 [Thunnus maccoyii]
METTVVMALTAKQGGRSVAIDSGCRGNQRMSKLKPGLTGCVLLKSVQSIHSGRRGNEAISGKAIISSDGPPQDHLAGLRDPASPPPPALHSSQREFLSGTQPRLCHHITHAALFASQLFGAFYIVFIYAIIQDKSKALHDVWKLLCGIFEARFCTTVDGPFQTHGPSLPEQLPFCCYIITSAVSIYLHFYNSCVVSMFLHLYISTS